MTAQQPESWITEALVSLSSTLESKNEDYRIGGEFSNFEHAAKYADVHPEDVMLIQIGIKIGRIIGLRRHEASPRNESLLDSYKDLAGYATILYGYALKEAQHG